MRLSGNLICSLASVKCSNVVEGLCEFVQVYSALEAIVRSSWGVKCNMDLLIDCGMMILEGSSSRRDTPCWIWNVCPERELRHLLRGDIMPTIKSFLVQYQAINESNTFTGGDCITGKVILDLEKGCEVTSLSVKLKGKAKTKWKEKAGSTTVTYQDEEKYFGIEHLIIESGELKDLMCTNCETTCSEPVLHCFSDSVIEMGYHAYPFTFTIPQQWVFLGSAIVPILILQTEL